MTTQRRHAHLSAGGVRRRRRTGTGHATGDDRAAGRHRGVLGRRPHLAAEDIFYERFPESMKDQAPAGRLRRRRLDARHRRASRSCRREFTRGAHAVRPARRARSTGDIDARLARARVRRHPPGAGLPQRAARPDGLARQGGPRASASASTTSTSPSVQERSGGRFYGVGLINWWDGDGARRTLDGDEGPRAQDVLAAAEARARTTTASPIDYNSPADVPRVGGDRGERPPGGAPHRRVARSASPCADNSVLIGMVHNVAPFREMFGSYVFGGILDRHPGLQVGWFEGGINWVPAALQDAEHLVRLAPAHGRPPDRARRRRTTGTHHMYASFMVDPLGLELIDRIGVDRVMWSSDYPHNESTFGYCNESLGDRRRRGRPRRRGRRSSSTNVKRFLGLDG